MRAAVVFFLALGACVTPKPPAPSYVDAAGEERRDLPVTEDDVRILERADAILAREAVWNRADTRECPEGAPTVSLFCALQRASVEILGTYDHRRAALQEVRFVIEGYGKEYDHRLMGFNNDPARSFADMKAVLAAAKERVRKRLQR